MSVSNTEIVALYHVALSTEANPILLAAIGRLANVKECAYCGAPFAAVRGDAQMCSPRCRKRKERRD